MNDQILTSLSIITAFHNKNRSVLETFLPLTEYGIALLCNESDSWHFDIDSLKVKIYNSSGIMINTLTLKSLLKKLKKEKRIELLDQGNYFRVIVSLKNEQDTYLQVLADNHRKVHKFVKKYKEHANDNREEHEITIWIYNFICEYRKFIDVSNNEIYTQFESEKYQSLLSFLSYINEYESELTDTFHSIYFGANIYSLINNSHTSIARKELENLVVYLDSNFVLRLMDLQESAFTTETKELFNTLKENKIKLKIFNETIEEIKNVLNYYLSIYKNNAEQYSTILSSTENINGVLGAYFRRKLSFSQIVNLIDNVENFVGEQGIDIDFLSRYKLEIKNESISDLYEIKYGMKNNDEENKYRVKKCEHYMQIIEVIKYLRSRSHQPCSCLGNSKYIFLTCDLKLNKYSYNITPNYKFPCVISQEMLANDLLLFSPTVFNRIAFQLLIALYRTSNYIDVHALDKLKDTIEEVAKDNPTDASFIIEATRNCENYTELNRLLNDDIDDKQQLLTLAEERKSIAEKNENTIKNQQFKLAESELAATEASERIKNLENELKKATEKERQLQLQQKEKQKNLFVVEMSVFIKKIKRISVCSCSIFALATAITATVTGLNYWFELPFKESWWAHTLAAICIIGSIVGAIYNGIDNKWLQHRIYKNEVRLSKKYELDQCDIDDVRKKYWNH